MQIPISERLGAENLNYLDPTSLQSTEEVLERSQLTHCGLMQSSSDPIMVWVEKFRVYTISLMHTTKVSISLLHGGNKSLLRGEKKRVQFLLRSFRWYRIPQTIVSWLESILSGPTVLQSIISNAISRSDTPAPPLRMLWMLD